MRRHFASAGSAAARGGRFLDLVSGWCKMVVLWRLWLSHVAFALVTGKEAAAAAEEWRSSLSDLARRRQRLPGGSRVVESSPALRPAPVRRALPGASKSPGQSCCFGGQRRYLVSCVWLHLNRFYYAICMFVW